MPFEVDPDRPEDAAAELIEARSEFSRAQQRLHRAVVEAARHPELRQVLTAGSNLTPRETSVINAMSNGATNIEIGNRLFIGINTVKTNVRTAFRRIGVDTRTQAVRWAIQNGLDASDLPGTVFLTGRPVGLSPVARQGDVQTTVVDGDEPSLPDLDSPPPAPLGSGRAGAESPHTPVTT